MAIENIIKCDACGKVKGPANRWWLLTFGKEFIAKPFHAAIPEEIMQAGCHVCGEECALKKFSEWMGKAQL